MGVARAAPPETEPFDALDRIDRAALDDWWLSRLRRALAVGDGLPFHRARYEAAGFDPERLRRLADLEALPPFGKRELHDALRSRRDAELGIERVEDPGGLVHAASSGTHGTSFVALPRRWREEQGVSSLRAHWWAGLRPGAPFLITAPAWHTYATVQTFFDERLGMPAVVIAGTYLPRFAGRVVDALRRFRPRFLTMFLPMAFSLLAEAARSGLAAKDPFASVETLVVTGAPITAGMRARVARETGVGRVLELAGSSENLLAVECHAQAGLHVVPDTCYVEVLDPATGRAAAPGARGRVVHSALVPWGSLFLRFDGGDLGTRDDAPCRCGLPSPRIKLVGRAEDAFACGDRTLLPYDVQAALEEEVPELSGAPFAILREGLAAGRLALALSAEDASDPLAAQAERTLARRLGAPVEIRLAPSLPLRFKGVPALVGEREL